MSASALARLTLAACVPAVLGLAAFGLGCGAAEEEPASVPAAPTVPAASPAPAPAALSEVGELAAGEVRISRSDAGVTLLARDAPRLEVLMELARVADFVAEPGVGRPAARRLTLALRDVSVEDALTAILAGVPHHRHYDFPTEADASPEPWRDGRTNLLAVTVGRLDPADAPGAAPQAPPALPPAPAPPPRSDAPDPPPSPAELERLREIEDGWQHPDPVRRIEATALMEPEGADLPRLIELLAQDPDPTVRVAAAEVLADGEGFDTAPALVGALGDEDSRVVVAVVEALEDLFDDHPDPQIRARIAELREHPDGDVRDAVESFEEWVED